MMLLVTSLIPRVESSNTTPHKLAFAPVISPIAISKRKLPISWMITIQIQLTLTWKHSWVFMGWVLFNISAEISSAEQGLANVTEHF